MAKILPTYVLIFALWCNVMGVHISVLHVLVITMFLGTIGIYN